MSDHIPDLTKMISDTPRTDAEAFLPHDSKYRVCDVDFVRQLERELNEANERIRLLIAERDTARRQADQNYKLRDEFRALLGTDDVEHGVAVVREMKERIKRLEEELERTKQDRIAIAKKTREPLLLKLDRAAERIKRLEEAGDVLEYASVILEAGEDPNGFEKLLIAQREWRKAKEAKP
jgi:hypothetical protein